MPLKIIKCEESSIGCFLKKIKDESMGPILSLENCQNNKKSFIVLGKVIKFIDTKPNEKCVKILVREVLPDASYGSKFKAIIKGSLALLVIDAGLRTGDRLGFFAPSIMENPAYVSLEGIKYILHIGTSESCLMWYAKKQYILAQTISSKEDKAEKDSKSNQSDSENRNNLLAQPTASKKVSIEEKNTNNNQSNSTNKINKTLDNRLNPQVKLVNILIPSSSQKMNPTYVYKNLSKVKADGLLGDLRHVNIIAVVSEVSKGLSRTTTGKYTIICKVVDDSVPGELINFDVHFFTPEPTIICQVERGDVLRLHRVKLESYMNDIDGRIFSSYDLVLFKKDRPERISLIKNLSLTEEDKKRVASLKLWYKEKYGFCLNSMLEGTTRLSCIDNEGEYNIVCKVVSQPVKDDTKVILSVTDGTVMQKGGPQKSSCLPSQYNLNDVCRGHLVTDVEVFERLSEYTKIKANDYVFLRSVLAIKKDDDLQLVIPTFVFPMILDHKPDKVMNAEKCLKAWEIKIKNKDNVRVSDDEVMEERPNGAQDGVDKLQEVEDVRLPCGVDTTEQVPHDPQMANEERPPSSGSRTQLPVMNGLSSKVISEHGGGNNRQNSDDVKDTDLFEEDPEDASTLVNLTLNNSRSARGIKRLRLESDLTERGQKSTSIHDNRSNATTKVTSWLTKHDNTTLESEDMDFTSASKLLLVDTDRRDEADLSSFIASRIKRVKAFIIKVVPDPTRYPQNLVSGYCSQGCHKLFLFSTIEWREVNNQTVPLCPSCLKCSQDKRLILMFMLQLHVMDRNGYHMHVHVCREHAETLFGCTVKEFLTDLSVQRSRTQLLVDNTMLQTSRTGQFPVLDMTVFTVNGTHCLANTTLKLPTNP